MPPDMSSKPNSDDRRFGGIRRLYGEAAAQRIAAAHVCVVGIGGVGSWAAEALARSGVGQLTLIDLDHVAESNINRQVHAGDATLGQAKVLAMSTRIAGFAPQCRVTAVEAFVDADNPATLLPACDALIDAIDQVRAKAALLAHCRRTGLAVVSTGAAGGRLDPTQIEVADLARVTHDPLLASVRTRLRRDHAFPREAKMDFGIECVFSREPVRSPQDDASQCEAPEVGPQGLSCAGYGSAVTVTACFGLTAAAQALARIVAL